MKHISIVIVLFLTAFVQVAQAAFDLNIALYARNVASGETVAGLAFAVSEDGKPLGECVTDTQGACNLTVQYETGNPMLAAEGYTFAPLKNSVGGGMFDTGPTLPLFGDGIAEFLGGRDIAVFLLVDTDAKKIGLDNDPQGTPTPLPVMPTATPTVQSMVLATAKTNLPTATPTTAPTLSTSVTETSVATPDPAATATPVNRPTQADVALPLELFLIGLVAVLLMVVIYTRKRKGQG